MGMQINTNTSALQGHTIQARLQTALNRLGQSQQYAGRLFVNSNPIEGVSTGGAALPAYFYVRDVPSMMLGSDTAISGGDGAITTVVVTVLGDYTVPDTDYTVQLNPSVTTMTVTLPTAAAGDGGIVVVKDVQGLSTAGKTVTVESGGSNETIDGQANLTLGVVDYQAVTVQSDGTNWYII